MTPAEARALLADLDIDVEIMVEHHARVLAWRLPPETRLPALDALPIAYSEPPPKPKRPPSKPGRRKR